MMVIDWNEINIFHSATTASVADKDTSTTYWAIERKTRVPVNAGQRESKQRRLKISKTIIFPGPSNLNTGRARCDLKNQSST